MSGIRTCMTCKYAVHQDFGYSNYTVEGTTFSCAKNLHPAGSFDEFYGEDNRLEHGKDCVGWVHGDGVAMDVDHESECDLTPEEREVWEMFLASEASE
jgi:hypothetical protein